jgi:hypothetical protein
MTPDDRARRAVRDMWNVEITVTPADVIARAIKEAERDAERGAYSRVLSILNEHKECESCVVIDELEDQIKELKESGMTADPT